MITADQIIAHAFGDYIVQSDWMAVEKTKRWFPALVHGLTYTVIFYFFTQSWWKLAVIALSHSLIDRYRLVRYIIWLKNWIGPNKSWNECSATGYPNDRPIWLTVWLMIIADNICHIFINGWVL